MRLSASGPPRPRRRPGRRRRRPPAGRAPAAGWPPSRGRAWSESSTLPPFSNSTVAGPAGPVQKQREHEEQDAKTDGGVGKIEGGWPVVHLDEVGHAAQAHAVDQVADGATGHGAQRPDTKHAADVALQRQDGYRADDDQRQQREQFVEPGTESERGAAVAGQLKP